MKRPAKKRAAKSTDRPAEPFNGVDLLGLEDAVNNARNAIALCWLAVPGLVMAPHAHGRDGLQALLAGVRSDLEGIAREIGRARE